MVEYLPDIYTRFRDDQPEVADALDRMGQATDGAGPLDDRTRRLIKLGIAIGAVSDGAVRSNVRKALSMGITPEEMRQVALLTITTRGFPAAVAGLGWIEEVLAAES